MAEVDADIAIVGAGLSGTVAASVLARAGYSVGLIDRNEVAAPEFRVEKIAGTQIALFDRLGLLPALAASGTFFDEIANAHRGRILDRTHSPHYGILYHDLVNAMRRELPASVRLFVDRVVDLETSADVQKIELAAHGSITARLLVLATGMSDILRAKLGIHREVLHERQSISFGFDARFAAGVERAVTYYGERASDGIDYVSFFPVGDTVRANLFCFLDHRVPWVKEMRTSPAAALASALPGLRRVIGDIEVIGRVQSWIMDLSVAREVAQPGVVLIGDAYQTSCPAAGVGVSRLMTDVERLCRVHIPAWLSTPGMDSGKIAGFYSDPVKQAMDANALRLANFRRNFTVDRRLPWRARRSGAFLRRRILHHIDAVSPSLTAGIRRLRRS
jgi:2-polyprenyl-6-methoxyphenol hydroxylase-like FAD-dependent oxidoreductase